VFVTTIEDCTVELIAASGPFIVEFNLLIVVIDIHLEQLDNDPLAFMVRKD
jgi:hypothetical protein